jgi:hypothetical protein
MEHTNMERTVAIKKLGKLLGKSLAYRVDPTGPTAEEREGARAALKDATANAETLLKQKEARIKALLDADQEYQQIKTAHEAAKKIRNRIASDGHRYKFTVGTADGMFFHVKAQGDSWEEVIRKVEGKL